MRRFFKHSVWPEKETRASLESLEKLDRPKFLLSDVKRHNHNFSRPQQGGRSHALPTQGILFGLFLLVL